MELEEYKFSIFMNIMERIYISLLFTYDWEKEKKQILIQNVA